MRFFEFARILAHRTAATKCESATVFCIFGVKAFFSADCLTDPKWTKKAYEMAYPTFFAIHRTDPRKITGIEA
jgi:hypothetical protein